MTTLLNYLNNSSCNSISSSPEKSKPFHDLKPSTTFVIQPQQNEVVLSKRLNAAKLGDLITKKLKTRSTNISSNASLEQSPLSKRNLSLNEDTTSKSLATDDDRSMAIEEPSDDEINLDRSCAKTHIVIPPFEGDSVLSVESTAHSTKSLSKMPSTDLSNFRANSALFGEKTDQEAAGQLLSALDVLKMRLMAQDEATTLRDAILKLYLAQEPVIIPPFVELNSVMETNPLEKEVKDDNKKDENEFEIVYGQVEFPFLSFSMPMESQNIAKPDFSKLLELKDKSLAMLDELSTPSKLSKRSSMTSEDEKKAAKKSKKESLAPTRAGTQKSSSDTESVAKKNKKEKKSILDTGKTQSQKSSLKVVESVKSEKEKSLSQMYLAEEGYSTIMNTKKSRSERQRTRWQLAQDNNFSMSNYLTNLIDGGFPTQKKVNIPIGSEYQIDLSTLSLKPDDTKKRALKMKWDPTSQTQSELQGFFKSLKSCLKTQVSQEQAIDLLTRNGNNIKKALNYAKNNKSKCLTELAVKRAANLIL